MGFGVRAKLRRSAGDDRNSSSNTTTKKLVWFRTPGLNPLRDEGGPRLHRGFLQWGSLVIGLPAIGFRIGPYYYRAPRSLVGGLGKGVRKGVCLQLASRNSVLQGTRRKGPRCWGPCRGPLNGLFVGGSCLGPYIQRWGCRHAAAEQCIRQTMTTSSSSEDDDYDGGDDDYIFYCC